MTTANFCLEMNYNLRKHQVSGQVKDGERIVILQK